MKHLDVMLAFKKIDKNSTFVAKSVAWFTRSEYYHVEIVIEDTWVSIFPETGFKLNKLKPLKDTWEYVKIEDVKLTREQYDIFKKYLMKQVGKKYDYLGIMFSQVLPLTIDSKNKWFCSEAVVKLAQMLYIEDTFDLIPESTSPGKLGKIFIKG